MRLGTILGQESPCERRYDRLCILLQSQLGQEEVRRRRDHVLQFDNKKIEEWHETRRGSSMWREDGVSIQGEIVPERFQRDHGIWAQVS